MMMDAPIALSRLSKEISVRTKPVGGPVRSVAAESPIGFLDKEKKITLLIHGFNVHLVAAGVSYDHFKKAAGSQLQRRSVSVFWPGDAAPAWFGGRDGKSVWGQFISAASYPWQPARAILTAQRLADLITVWSSRAAGRLDVNIVAHSLGCRVTLELLLLLRSLVRGSKKVRIPSVILMAAAVPRFLISRDSNLRLALELPDRVLLYHSRNDRVLKFAFKLGQFLERPFPLGWDGQSRYAIGLRGIGLDRPENVVEIAGTQDHGDYWTDPAIAKKASEPQSRQLQPRTLAWLSDPTRQLPQKRRSAIGRQLKVRTVG